MLPLKKRGERKVFGRQDISSKLQKEALLRGVHTYYSSLESISQEVDLCLELSTGSICQSIVWPYQNKEKAVKLLSLDSYHKSRVNTLNLCLFSFNTKRETSILPQTVAMGTPKIHMESIQHDPRISCVFSYVHVLLLLILSVPFQSGLYLRDCQPVSCSRNYTCNV